MIVKLMPDQITDLWDSIRYGIINAVVPIIDPKPEYIQDILCQLLRQDMQCWCVFDKDKNILGYIITSISVDINTGYRTLLVYSLFLYKSIDRAQWDSLYDALERFGKANKCSRMTAYSANPDAISIAEKLGFMKDYTYLIKDI